MSNRNSKEEGRTDQRRDDMSNKGAGKQGIDQDPSKEGSKRITDPVYITQKGKNKVDGDPSKESDQPVDEQIL